MQFKDWLWGKYDEWRKGTNRGVVEFAAYLGVKQPSLSGWLSGNYTPGAASLKKIAEIYPDVLEVFGGKKSEPVLPPEYEDLMDRIALAISKSGFSVESPEAVKIAKDILDEFISKRKERA
jgi:transcriptional regulator with XRE-family HTH domain